jgi:hypothetical protein
MADAIAHELLLINGIGEATLNKLMSGGIDSIVQLSEAAIDYIINIDIPEAVATKIVSEAVTYLAQKGKEALTGEDTPEEAKAEEKPKKSIAAKVKAALGGGASVAPTGGSLTIKMKPKRRGNPRRHR